MNSGTLDDIVIQKITSMQRCVARSRESRKRAGDHFATDFDLQDAAVLNVIRACETAIDLANMVIRHDRLGIPADTREAFELLVREKRITVTLGERMMKMVGFRNIAVHQYRRLSPEIVTAVIDSNLDELLEFCDQVRKILNR
jgi:uncharacterized protein YutE (UPF0331/DUF86 family)